MSRFTIVILATLFLLSTLARADKEEETLLVDEVNSIDAFPEFYLESPKPMCYRCSAPCDKRTCCSGQFPQCCQIAGRCRCCRSDP